MEDHQQEKSSVYGTLGLVVPLPPSVHVQEVLRDVPEGLQNGVWNGLRMGPYKGP